MFQYDFEKEEDVTEYLKVVGTEASYQCFSEHDPDACHRLAEFYDTYKKDSTSAANLYRKNCDDHKYGRSCYRYALFALAGVGNVKKSEEIAFDYWLKSCENKCPEGCFNAGNYLLKKNKSTSLPDNRENSPILNAVDFFKRSCHLGRSEGCLKLFSMFYTGNEGVKQNISECLKYAHEGCDRYENLNACAILTKIYTEGKIVDKDERLSDKYQEKTQKIREQLTNPTPQVTG